MTAAIPKPIVWILAGPNGSGKTTFYEKFLRDRLPEFVNPDRIALELSPGNPDAANWEQVREEVANRQERLFHSRTEFVTETVFSHESKLDLIDHAKAAGFHTRVVFLCTEDPALNAARVSIRVGEGGHGVPFEKIEARYVRSVSNMLKARLSSDELWLYDNSTERSKPKLVARYSLGLLSMVCEDPPAWAVRVLGPEFETWRHGG